MCIIIAKENNINMPTKNELRYLWDRNPDGAGFMYSDGGHVKYQKGFMTFRAFYKALNRVDDIDKKAVVIHFRIATHGGINKAMCHPFEITTSRKRLTATHGTCQLAVAHNGIIQLTADAKNSLSDTALFTRDYLTRLCKKQTYYRDEVSVKIISELIGTSRLAILSGNGHIEYIGHWYTQNGVKYSNTGYKRDTYSKGKKLKKHVSMYGGSPCDYCVRNNCFNCEHYQDMYNEYCDSYDGFYRSSGWDYLDC